MEGLEIKIKKRLLTVSSLHLIFGRLKLLSDTNNIFYIFFDIFRRIAATKRQSSDLLSLTLYK